MRMLKVELRYSGVEPQAKSFILLQFNGRTYNYKEKGMEAWCHKLSRITEK